MLLHRAFVLAFVAASSAVPFAACGGSTSGPITGSDAQGSDAASEANTDPCAGKDLPQCPRRCDAFPMQGACAAGDRCAVSEVGDGCECQGGAWACAVHPPLGPGCNAVCRGLAGPSDAGVVADGGSCDPNAKEPCGALSYCKSSDCVTGVCAPRPAEASNAESPVCGCDGFTYWNDNVAASRGASVRSSGACAPGVACGGGGGATCADGFSCNLHVPGVGGCAALVVSGTCWALPTTCPTILIGPNTRACASPTCEGRCALVRKQAVYYEDNTCPQ
jgi:hypothetical protein